MPGLILKFLFGVAILLVSTEIFVKTAKKLSKAFKLSPLIIGITVVAIGTSLPELAFSLMALIKKDVGLAMGNIVGSNIINILFVFPVGIIVGKLRVGTTKTQRNAIFLLFISAIFLAMQLITSIPSQTVGLILISLALIATLVEYFFGVSGRKEEDKKMFDKKSKINITPSFLIMPFFLIVGIVVGSFLAVNSIEELSLATGVSTTILGLTLTAVVTSLPELMTTIFSQEEHQAKLAIGNILGSNIYNLLLIGGIINLLVGRNGIPLKDWVIFSFVTLLFVISLKKYSGKNIPKNLGFILLAAFILYLMSMGWNF
jgi:cation:H+ antiporter